MDNHMFHYKMKKKTFLPKIYLQNVSNHIFDYVSSYSDQMLYKC